MLANIMGGFISIIISTTIFQYAWNLNLLPRLGLNFMALSMVFVGLGICYTSLRDVGLLE
jgi:hypothetical protein